MPTSIPGVAHLRDRLDVVEVAVRREHAAHAGRARHLEQQLVLVGRVDDHRVAVALAAQHVHVVLERSDDDLLDADVARLVVRQQGRDHATKATDTFIGLHPARPLPSGVAPARK